MLAHCALLLLTSVFLRLAQSQFVASLPQCIQDCIDQSGDENCSVTDIKCLCRASAGNFLPDLITCMHGNCDNALDNDLLLTPFQLVCEIAGAPIPESAIENAENVGSSLATQVTKTVTMDGSSASGGGIGATTTLDVASSSVSTVTVTTTQGGSVIDVVYPVTWWRTTTNSGSGSTITPGATTTKMPGLPETSSSSSGLSPQSSNPTISLAAASTSSRESSATKTKDAPSEDSTNSAPFKDTNSASRGRVGNLLGLALLLVMGIAWF